MISRLFWSRDVVVEATAMADDARNALLEVEIFTDGACEGNPGPGGYGVVLKFGRHRKEVSGAFKETTNNRMELLAAVVGLRALNRRCRVRLTTDSEYLCQSITQGWAERWRDNGWWRTVNQRAANPDLWALLLDLLGKHEVTISWTRGHAGHAENERCDWLATQAIGAADAAIDEGYEQSKIPEPTSIPEGHPCFKCRTPVVKRFPKEKKVKRAFRYEWYLYCPNCATSYLVEAGRQVPSNTMANTLFDELDAEALSRTTEEI
jgi:ribonuclease HI